MGENKASIGRMINKMQFLKPESVKYATGEEIVEYKPASVFLSDIVELSSNSERIDNVLSGRTVLKFNALYYKATTDWKVEYNGMRFDIDKVVPFDRSLYASYECSKIDLK